MNYDHIRTYIGVEDSGFTLQKEQKNKIDSITISSGILYAYVISSLQRHFADDPVFSCPYIGKPLFLTLLFAPMGIIVLGTYLAGKKVCVKLLQSEIPQSVKNILETEKNSSEK
ncbi:hypothetical protein KBB25_01645 [Candidatus Gracilibacteria bacterium]|nr:hypothetical protein [Candidatus Gracilibacteria bacterium]